MPAESPTLTATPEQPLPDLVHAAWQTEGRIQQIETSLSPTMNDLRDVRIQVQEIAAELHDTKVEVQAVAHMQRGMDIELHTIAIDQRHMKTEIHAMAHDQRRMKTEILAIAAEQRKHSVILDALVDHFGVAIPTDEVATDTAAKDEDQAQALPSSH